MLVTKKKDDTYITFERTHGFCSNYQVPENLKEVAIPFLHSQPDVSFAHSLFGLLLEFNNPNSTFKPYFDILPRQPDSLAYKYSDNSNTIEWELKGFAAKRKAIEAKLAVDRLVTIYKTFFQSHPETFDLTFLTEKNIEWAILTLNTRLMTLDKLCIFN